MRDTHATGTGSIMGAGTAGYCVGNLRLDGHTQPWEDTKAAYPPSLASPEQVGGLPAARQGRGRRGGSSWTLQGREGEVRI